MKRAQTIFLQAIIIVIGTGALTFLLWEPHVEGRNAHATLFQIYFNDPFLAFAYVGSTPFFVALYQAFRLLGYVRQDKTFSEASIKALRRIKYCALAIIVFVAIGEIFILSSNSDDHAPGVMMGVVITFGSIVTAAAASTLEGLLEKAYFRSPQRS
jgi:drug/metabolite transporter (DMT)-like permease